MPYKDREKRLEYIRERRNKLHASGYCTRCLANLARPGKRLCQECLDYLNSGKKEYIKDKTKCWSCAKQLDEISLLQGARRCMWCADRVIHNKRRSRARQTT